jgi:hypothetical protein
MKKTNTVPTKRVLSNESVEILFGRRSGNSTRIIDKIIQDLFKGYPVRVKDHHESRNADHALWLRVIDRIYREHRHIYENSLCVNRDALCIWLEE